jgi:hypothetical protein
MRRVLLSTATAAFIIPMASSAAPPADSIEYALPDTMIQVKLDLVLESCATPGTLAMPGNPLIFKPTVTVTPEAKASASASNRYRIDGAELASWWQKRDVALTLNENGTLKSIGLASEDRTAAIIGNVIKLGTTIATLGIAPFYSTQPVQAPECTPETAAKTRELSAVRAHVRQLEDKLAASFDPVAIKNIKEAIDRLSARAGELRTGPDGPLFLTMTKKIAPPDRPGSVDVKWDADDFKEWFGSDSAEAAALAALAIDFAPASLANAPVADNSPPTKGPFIVVREPVLATLTVTPAGKGKVQGFEEAKAKATAWIAQWGGKSYYMLRSGFGESKKLALELDPFGRKTSMTVNRDARAENVTGGLASIGDAAVAFQAANSETHEQELRIKELETQQKYNQLKLCEAIIEEGGFTCPSTS